MDDNNLNIGAENSSGDTPENDSNETEILNEDDNAETEILNENDNVETDLSNKQGDDEKSEFKKFMENNVDNQTSEYSYGTDSSSENDSDDDDGKKKKGSKKTTVLIVVIVICLIAGICALVYMIMRSSSSSANLNKSIVENVSGIDEQFEAGSDSEITVAEFALFYAQMSSYSAYGYTPEQIREQAESTVKYINYLYAKAIAAGYTADSIQSDLESEMENVSTYAEQQSQTSDAMLSQSFGFDITADQYKKIITKQLIANSYYSAELEKIKKEQIGDIESEYEANKKDYDLADASYYYFELSADNAKTNADSIITAVNNGTSFDAAIASVTGDSTKKVTSLRDLGYSDISNNFSKDIADWVFAQDDDGNYTSVKNSITTIEDEDNGILYVVYATNAPARNEILPANVEYIFVSTEVDDDESKSADEIKIAAKKKANDIFTAFTDNGANANAFSSVISYYSNDKSVTISTNSSDNTSNIVSVTGDNSTMNETAETWALASTRKANDCDIIETEDGYYVIFFVSRDTEPVWYSSVMDGLYENASSKWQTAATAEANGAISLDATMIDAYIASISTESK